MCIRDRSVIVIYRKDQEFVLKDVIPNKNNGKTDYDLIIASQPYRSRVTAEKKVKYVIEPMLKSLAKKGKLVVVHACGGDPSNKIIKKIWPKENPFPYLYKSTYDFKFDIIKQKILDDHEIILSQLPSLTPTIAKKHFHETGTQRLFQKFCIVLSSVKKAVEDIFNIQKMLSDGGFAPKPHEIICCYDDKTFHYAIKMENIIKVLLN